MSLYFIKINSHLLLCFFLFLGRQLNGEPIKVPTEKYKGHYDKRTHSGHYPFISYLTFRNICDHKIDDAAEWFDPELVEEGDTIYLNIWYLEWFVEKIHDRIPVPYILVTCDVSAWLPALNLKKLLYDPKLTAWFCRNMVFSYHPKLFQIPTGQDLGQFILDDPCITFYLLEEIVLNKPFLKKHLLHMCHYPRKYGERDQLVKLFENEPYVLTCNRSDQPFGCQTRPIFYKEMASCQFVLSPIGLETDSVRTWEALVLDCIPIVEHTFLDPSYDHLPVAMVHEWSEVNPAFLEKKYEELKNRPLDEAYFDYWYRLIRNYQKKVRQLDLSHSELESTRFNDADMDFFALLKNLGALQTKLYYKGFLTSLRSLQIAKQLDLEIYLFDPYLDQKTFGSLSQYVKDKSVLKNQRMIHLISQENEFLKKAQSDESCAFFLDLTYYRTSLFVNFRSSLVEYGNFRQSLKKDLASLYNSLNANSLLFGNMANDSYVKEVLQMFAKENQLTVETQGSFWRIKK